MIKVSGFFSLIFFCLLLNSCNNEPIKKDVSPKTDQENNELIKNQFIKANQQLMQKENDEMDYYAKSHQLNFIRTGSGIRYFVYKPSIKGDSIKDNIKITLNFTLKFNNSFRKKILTQQTKMKNIYAKTLEKNLRKTKY